MLRAYENAAIYVRRGGKTERRREKKKENAVKPGRDPGWMITFFGVVLLSHTVCGVF